MEIPGMIPRKRGKKKKKGGKSSFKRKSTDAILKFDIPLLLTREIGNNTESMTWDMMETEEQVSTKPLSHS